MNRAVRTGVPPRVVSVTSTTPRPCETSTRRPTLVAVTSYVLVVAPASTTISTRSPFTCGTTSGRVVAFQTLDQPLGAAGWQGRDHRLDALGAPRAVRREGLRG